MKNLLNFFFSFDKLFKEKLIVPFFWLALIVWGLSFFEEALRAIKLPPLAAFVGFFNFFASILLALVTIRIISELMVAIFRINDNLSPDKGQSELADIDPIAEARKAAEMAASRTREATHSLSEKASAATKSVRHNVDEVADTVQAKAKSVTQSTKAKTESVMGKGSVSSPEQDPTPVKVLEPTAKTATAAKVAATRRGRPAGSKNKTKKATSKATTKPSTSAKTTAPKKRGPKPGSKAPRDADGNLLKKDGTPRKKPGPKPKD